MKIKVNIKCRGYLQCRYVYIIYTFVINVVFVPVITSYLYKGKEFFYLVLFHIVRMKLKTGISK